MYNDLQTPGWPDDAGFLVVARQAQRDPGNAWRPMALNPRNIPRGPSRTVIANQPAGGRVMTGEKPGQRLTASPRGPHGGSTSRPEKAICLQQSRTGLPA